MNMPKIARDWARHPFATRRDFDAVDDTADSASIATEIRGLGKRISFVSGNFNVVHPGHLRLLRFAREIADLLVVGVNPVDNPGYVVPASQRLDWTTSLLLV